MNKKALFLTVSDIINDGKSGGIQCSAKNYEMLCQYFGADNVYIGIVSNKTSEQKLKNGEIFRGVKNKYESLLASLSKCRFYLQKNEQEIVDFIKGLDIDLLYMDSSLLGKILYSVKTVKTIVFFHNVEKNYAKNIVLHRGLQFLPVYWASSYNEKKAISKADKIICLNERDANLLFKTYKRSADLILPITFTDCLKIDRRKKIYNKKLLFIGSDFPPNLDGITWFIKNVMPNLEGITLTVVGKGFEKRRKTLSRKNVEIIGTVEDLEIYYYSYPAMVMPILYGEGMKVKTGEAMMYGKTIFGTKEAFEGYEIEGVSGFYCCNTAKQFITQITQFFNMETIPCVQDEVRNLFLEKYETKNQQQKLAGFLDDIFDNEG